MSFDSAQSDVDADAEADRLTVIAILEAIAVRRLRISGFGSHLDKSKLAEQYAVTAARYGFHEVTGGI